ncbi:hypothetical protein [Hydrogenimonas sp.]
MNREDIKTKLDEALSALYRFDNYLLEKNGSERSIAHCLANHLQRLFTEYDLDCEYNINIDVESGKKEINMLKEELKRFDRSTTGRRSFSIHNENYYTVSVFPDIIVHKRGRNDRNLVVLELKKSNSTIDSEYDELKLKKYTSDYFPMGLKYRFGIFVNVHTKKSSGYRYDIKLYENGEEVEEYIKANIAMA